jgi:hypothetical protein
MSKTTTIKITTRIITTHLPYLDTKMTIKSHALFFGETYVSFGEPMGDEVPIASVGGCRGATVEPAVSHPCERR